MRFPMFTFIIASLAHEPAPTCHSGQDDSPPPATASLVDGEPTEPAPPAIVAPTSQREIAVTVANGQYQPATISIFAGESLTLVMTRTEYNRCTEEVVFQSLNRRVSLPPEVPVRIALGVLPVGETAFTCGMGMVKGKVIVQEAR